MDVFEPVGNSGNSGSKSKESRGHLPARKRRRRKGMVFHKWKNNNTVLITVSAQDLGLLQIIKSKQPAPEL